MRRANRYLPSWYLRSKCAPHVLHIRLTWLTWVVTYRFSESTRTFFEFRSIFHAWNRNMVYGYGCSSLLSIRCYQNRKSIANLCTIKKVCCYGQSMFVISHLPAPVSGSSPGTKGIDVVNGKADASQSFTPPLTESQLVWGEYREILVSRSNDTIRSFQALKNFIKKNK